MLDTVFYHLPKGLYPNLFTFFKYNVEIYLDLLNFNQVKKIERSDSIIRHSTIVTRHSKSSSFVTRH